MFNWLIPAYLKALKGQTPEIVLKRSLNLLDIDAVESLKEFIKSRHNPSGAFADKGGKDDLYYTLFGTFLAEAFDLDDLLPFVRIYVENEVIKNSPHGVHMHCSAILASRLGSEKELRKKLDAAVRKDLASNPPQSGYHSFLHLLTGYYTRDFRSLWLVNRKLSGVRDFKSMPCPVVAAFLVLQQSLGRPVVELKKLLMTFYHDGGFKATHASPITDLLSTAVSLYALDYAGHDLRMIKPDCLSFVDSLFTGAGFAGNIIDDDADVEYTFYGLLSLGALAG